MAPAARQSRFCGALKNACFLLRSQIANLATDMSISISEAAAKHVTKYIAKRGKGVGVRLGVKTTGCSGLAYKL